MSKLGQGEIQVARATAALLRTDARLDVGDMPFGAKNLPGYEQWWSGSMDKAVDREWAEALEAAIAEAVGKDADPRQPGPVSDADERAFWRDAYALAHGVGGAEYAASEATKALAGYRAAFGGAK